MDKNDNPANASRADDEIPHDLRIALSPECPLRLALDLQRDPEFRAVWRQTELTSGNASAETMDLRMTAELFKKFYDRQEVWTILQSYAYRIETDSPPDNKYLARLLARGSAMAKAHYHRLGPIAWFNARIECLQTELEARRQFSERASTALRSAEDSLSTFRQFLKVPPDGTPTNVRTQSHMSGSVVGRSESTTHTEGVSHGNTFPATESKTFFGANEKQNTEGEIKGGSNA